MYVRKNIYPFGYQKKGGGRWHNWNKYGILTDIVQLLVGVHRVKLYVSWPSIHNQC